MHQSPETVSAVSEDDVIRLARFAGLVIPAERLPRVTAELNATLAIIADLEDIAPSDLAPATDTFDPAWPEGVWTTR